MYKFGFVGCGNMGGALALAVSKTEKSIALSDNLTENAENTAKKTGGSVVSTAELVKASRYVVLGVKPQVLPSVLSEIAPVLNSRKDRYTVISMAAGVPMSKITEVLGENTPVIRIMPNTPAAVGHGMIVYTVNGNVESFEKEEFEKAFEKAGKIEEIPESLIDAASAISGCGPAFVYMFVEALADGGVKCGLQRNLAAELAAITVEGAAQTVIETHKHPGELKDAVCSPAGSTIEGVAVLEKNSFRGTVAQAVNSAYQRTKELGK